MLPTHYRRRGDTYTALRLSEATLPQIMRDADDAVRAETGQFVRLVLRAKRGIQEARAGDWVVTSALTGEREVLSPSEFSKRFEPA
jgi:hypothetical protein